MLALLKKYSELMGPMEALLQNDEFQYQIGADWVTYAGNGMCRKVGKGAALHTMDVSKVTAIKQVKQGQQVPEATKEAKKKWWR